LGRCRPPLARLAHRAVGQSKSTPPSSSHSATSNDQTNGKTSLATHRCNVRCTLASSPNSRGRTFHWHPVRIW
jgi:hypothetical protein